MAFKTIIEPLPPEALEAPELKPLLEQARELGVPDDLFLRILAHAPGYAEALFDAMHRSHAMGGVDHKLKEIIRIRLARQAGDPYFAGLRSQKAMADGLTEETIEAGYGDYQDDPRFSDAEKWALDYARLMYLAPKQVDKAFYDTGKTYYSEAQIMELGAFIALHYGMQVWMGTLGVSQE